MTAPAIKSFARIAVLGSMCIGLGSPGIAAAADADVIVASGTLGGEVLDGALFSIGDFWMRVPARTAFNRWLSEGLHQKVVIILTTNPARFEDAKNVRILSGTLMHDTAPNPTPAATDVIGSLPRGNLSVVHELFLKDELTGSLGPVTFETADFETVAKFDVYDGAPINIVIKIE